MIIRNGYRFFINEVLDKHGYFYDINMGNIAFLYTLLPILYSLKKFK